jgi:hypothetical protein
MQGGVDNGVEEGLFIKDRSEIRLGSSGSKYSDSASTAFRPEAEDEPAPPNDAMQNSLVFIGPSGVQRVFKLSEGEAFQIPAELEKLLGRVVVSLDETGIIFHDPAFPKEGRGKVLPNRVPSIIVDPRVESSYQYPHSAAENSVARDKRIITRDGVNYVPLFLAAWLAQASETTLRGWIDQRAKFDGKVVRTYTSPATLETYVSEESVGRMAARFVTWPSNKPAGVVNIGETNDKSGYLGLPSAARAIGVSSRTMWLWATQGKSPIQKDLAVIRCTTSDHFYIRQSDVESLKLLHRPKGLKRGPKPRSLSHG